MGALWLGLQPDNNKPSVDGINGTLINTLIKLVIYPSLDESCTDWWGLRHVYEVAEEEGLEC